jgi:hypothetical protein
MPEENDNKQYSVTVPEKHFPKWLQDQTRIAELKIRYDFRKEALPHFTVITIFLLTALIYPVALVGIVPTLLHFVFKTMRKDRNDLH